MEDWSIATCCLGHMIQDGQPRPLPRTALWGGGMALFAVALELWGSWGTGASTSAPASWFVAAGWPTPLRVLWWTLATVGVFTANRGLAHVMGSSRRVATALAVLPFAVFTLGIALGAEWSTWH